ncbi:MAG: Hsp20/alpha crystallin family protein [bacterium]
MLALRRRNPLWEDAEWPFAGLMPLTREMDRFGRGFAPATEVTTGENAWMVKMAVPGMELKDVTVEVTGNVLTVTGEHEMEEDKEGETTRTEFHYGRFERRFELPKTVNVAGVTAELNNGMLALTLPMMEEAKARTIEVKKGGNFFKKTA